MNFIFFLSITTLFLFFFGSYLCSPEHNPKVKEVMDDAESVRQGKRATREHAFSEDHIKIAGGLSSFMAIIFSIGLIVMVPFLRAVAAIVMAGLVVRFFYRRFFGTSEAGGNIAHPLPNTPDTAPVHVFESNAGEKPPGTGGGTSH